MKIEVDFNVIIDSKKYPSKMTLEIPTTGVSSLSDIDILTYEYLDSLLTSEVEVVDIMLS